MNGNGRKCIHCGEYQYMLTSRHVEVVTELTLHPGASTKQLAQQLCISPHTLRRHLADIYQELGVSNRLDCVITCLRLGIINADQLQISPIMPPRTPVQL